MNVEIIHVEERTVYGLWMKSSDMVVSKDIKSLSEKYRGLAKDGDTVPFFVLARDYSEETKEFELFTGGLKEYAGLEKLVIAEGSYAKITVKPKLGFLWGLSIGEAKRYFYQKWLPSSEFRGLNMEYEYHTEKTLAKHQSLDIIFAIAGK